MKFRYLYLILLLFIIGLFGCRENIVDFNPELKTGDLYINSNPDGATIFFNETRTGKITPDSLINLQPGSYRIRVSLLGVGEETISVSLVSGEKKFVNINFR